jgi:hypothetical protein
MDIEDLLKQMQADELEDKLVEFAYATPIEYARSRGIAPQKVYYHLRKGHLDWHVCDCGRRVVSVAEADALLFPERTTPEGDEDGSGSAREHDEDEEAGEDACDQA